MDKKVLLVADDVEMNRTVIKRFLKHDFDILEAENGMQVIKTLGETHVDALLLDIIMPEMDGLEVLRCLQDGGEHSKLGILVATSTKEKTERTALSLGADDVVSKPYDPLIIQKRLRNILSTKEAEQQRDLLQTKDVEELLKKQKEALFMKTAAQVSILENIAQVIRKNKQNEKLLDEMTMEIEKEAEKILTAFSETE